MRTAPPPENVPLERPFTPEELSRLRQAYAADFGTEPCPTDAELIALARETLRLVSVVLRITRAQAARRNERGQ